MNQLREAVEVLPEESSLRAAVDDLLKSGFDRSDVRVVSGWDWRREANAAVAGSMSHDMSFMHKIGASGASDRKTHYKVRTH